MSASFEGYAPQDKQPIDLAIWGGPRQAPLSRWRCYANGLTWLPWRRWRPGRGAWPGQGNAPLARLLIGRGATYDLTVASALNDLAAVRSMLDAAPSRISEQRPDDRRPLSAAAEFGRLDIVRLLLERGSDPTWPDADSSERGAALHAAARRGDREMVELLLKYHADPNGFVNASGNAVYAAKTPEIRRLLEAHGGCLDPYDLVWKGEDDEVMRIVTERPETALAGCGGVFTAVVTCGRRKLMRRLLDDIVKEGTNVVAWVSGLLCLAGAVAVLAGCYNRFVRRLVLAVIVGLLTLSASGVSSLVVNEPCTGHAPPGSDDGACPPTCVTCGCCAQAVEPVLIVVATSPEARVADTASFLPDLLRTTARDILHVPKLRLL